jgi:hypothetical protein
VLKRDDFQLIFPYTLICMQKILLLFLAFQSLCFSSEIMWKGTIYNDETIAEMVTVITATNPIPSIPSTRHLYEAQKSLFQVPVFAQCKKIIVFDGIKEPNEQNTSLYEEYKSNVKKLVEKDPYFSNTTLVFCNSWGHLSGAIKEALEQVKTPFVFMHQHDFVLLQPFDLKGVIATMVANPRIKCVLLGKRANHKRDFYYKPVDEVIEGAAFIPLCRASGWADSCHVASVDYYKTFVLPQCDHTFMEKILHPALKQAVKKLGPKGQEPFGTYLYGKMDDGPYVFHTNGRKN